MEQLTGLLDPTMRGSKDESIFQAARAARRQCREQGLSKDDCEISVLKATIRARYRCDAADAPNDVQRPRASVPAPRVIDAPAQFRCPLDGTKYLMRSRGAAVMECPRGLTLGARDGGRQMCYDGAGRTAAQPTPRYCCRHGEGAYTQGGRKFIIRRNASGNGQFCDNVMWAALMRADLRRQGIPGWDRVPREAPSDSPNVIVPLPAAYMTSQGALEQVTLVYP
jgi:hypothetical protein